MGSEKVLPSRRHVVRVAVCGVVGVLISVYMTYEHYADDESMCDVSEIVSCSIVNKSAFAEMFNVPLGALGAAYNVVLLYGAYLAGYQRAKSGKAGGEGRLADLVNILFVWCLLGMGFVLYLLSVEVYLGAICPFCTVIHILIGVSSYSAWRIRSEVPGASRVVSLGPLWRQWGVVATACLVMIVPLISFNGGVWRTGGGSLEGSSIVLTEDEFEYYRLCFGGEMTGMKLRILGTNSDTATLRQKEVMGGLWDAVIFSTCDTKCQDDSGLREIPSWILQSTDGEEVARHAGPLSLDGLYGFARCLE